MATEQVSSIEYTPFFLFSSQGKHEEKTEPHLNSSSGVDDSDL